MSGSVWTTASRAAVTVSASLRQLTSIVADMDRAATRILSGSQTCSDELTDAVGHEHRERPAQHHAPHRSPFAGTAQDGANTMRETFSPLRPSVVVFMPASIASRRTRVATADWNLPIPAGCNWSRQLWGLQLAGMHIRCCIAKLMSCCCERSYALSNRR
jgi:hypothetical protein